MHEFKYKNNQLYCENIKVEELARKFGTPLYVYSYKTIITHFLKLKRAFSLEKQEKQGQTPFLTDNFQTNQESEK